MSRTRDQYVVEVANTVLTLFESGVNDPSSEEIAEAHFPSKALGGEITEGIRKRLGKIRDLIEQDYELPVYLLNARYYRRFRSTPPSTTADGRRCLPLGRSNSAAGICLNKDGDSDFVWQAMISQGLGSAAGKLKRGFDRTLEAVEEHRLDDVRAAEILENAKRRAQPNKQALAEQVLRSLQEADED